MCSSIDILEKAFQDIINNSDEIKRGISEILLDKKEVDNANYEKEVEYINGITSDFTITDGQFRLLSTLECKRADIGVTEYVRGIGQLFQYEYFFEQKISPRKFSEYLYDEGKEYNTAIVIPSDFYKNTTLNIGRFKYPKSTKIIEINLASKNVREIDRKLLDEFAKKDSNTTAISSYYLRDNRIFEYFIALQYINYWHFLNPGSNEPLNRKKMEEHLKKTETINNGNWRNVFITLASLGFTDSKNHLTSSGRRMAMLDLSEFSYTLFDAYIKPYIKVLLATLNNNRDSNTGKVNLSNQEIVEKIKEEYSNKEVLYLTESRGRYVSSWLNIMRDDYGFVDFKPRNNTREVKYDPFDLSKDDLIQKIKEQPIAKRYCEKFYELLRNGDFNN
ncbi:hypothetical protein HMPREF2607_00510 [Streptococcus sp. HMSC078H03]|jgi:hypothetical protein|uniref:hypothetical protein n=1 Tax=Streptococcus TaxID=1301 RepID=UPI0008A41C70|nr:MULTISPECIES: hypothetical protein [Streptococcus]OFO02187.1 hypothetical protein HMPREF2607_00510 [Streptococcus sp. HMSC078H03]